MSQSLPEPSDQSLLSRSLFNMSLTLLLAVSWGLALLIEYGWALLVICPLLLASALSYRFVGPYTAGVLFIAAIVAAAHMWVTERAVRRSAAINEAAVRRDHARKLGGRW